MTNTCRFSRQSGRTFVLIAVAVGALAAGLMVSSKLMERTQDLRAAQVFPEARPLPEFELHRPDGDPLTPEHLRGQWSLVFFGFTNCPDICPDTLAVLDSILQDLDTMGAAEKPQVVFISVDPERDDAEALADYVGWFNEDFIAATGSQEALKSLTGKLGVVYFLGEPDDSGFYNVDHSASIMIVDPQGRVFGRFAPPFDRQAMAADLFTLVR